MSFHMRARTSQRVRPLRMPGDSRVTKSSCVFSKDQPAGVFTSSKCALAALTSCASLTTGTSCVTWKKDSTNAVPTKHSSCSRSATSCATRSASRTAS